MTTQELKIQKFLQQKGELRAISDYSVYELKHW